MTQILKFLMAGLLISFSATTLAQCLPMQGAGPPRMFDSRLGCYVPAPNTVSYGQYNGYQVPIPTGFGAGQPFIANVGGRNVRCSLVDRGASALFDAGVANFGAYAINKLLGKGKEVVNRTGAGVVGAIYGATDFGCDPNWVNDGNERPAVFAGQQGYGQQQSFGGGNQAPRTVRVPSDCDIDGRPDLQDLKGLTEAQCAAVAGLATKRGYSQQVAEAPKPASDGKIRACMLRESQNSPVIAVSVPDPNNPQWKVVPSEPGESCQAWKDRIKTV